MALVVNNTDELSYSLTTYGLERIAEALKDRTTEINLFKIKVGDANGEYYIPEEDTKKLRNELPNGEFYILDKELLEDGITVSLHTIIPETLDNCEIREIGIYETVNNEDKLFAISTMQPLVKPSVDLGYVISADYYAFLKSQNLAELYDQIILSPENQLVTQEDLEKLMDTILYTESNLMEQISSNTRILGLNRVQQLYEQIQKDKKDFGYLTTYNNYSSLLNFVSYPDIFAYWIFDYPKKLSSEAEIADIGKYGRNLSTSISAVSLPREYQGFTSFLDFSDPEYFYLEQEAQELVYQNNNLSFMPEELSSIISLSTDGIASRFTKNDYIEAGEIDASVPFEIKIRYKVGTSNAVRGLLSLVNGDLEIVVRSNNTFGVNVKDTEGVRVTLNTSLKVNDNVWRTYRVKYDTEELVIESSNDEKTWERINSAKVTLGSRKSLIRVGRGISDSSSFSGFIDLKSFSVISEGIIISTGGRNVIANEVLFVDEERSTDTSFTMAFVLEPVGFGKRTLLARSNYAENSHVFEISETSEGAVEIKLFENSDNYLLFTTSIGDIPRNNHSLIISYEADNKTIRALLNGKELDVKKEVVGTYSHMNTSSYVPLTSYIIGQQGSPEKLIDSKVGTLIIIKDLLNESDMRTLALLLEAARGQNPCIHGV